VSADSGFRFRINLNAGEIEFGGSEAFVREMMGRVDEFVTLLNVEQSHLEETEPSQPMGARTSRKAPLAEAEKVGELHLPESFGEFLLQFPKDLTDHDKALIAGYFIQSRSQENQFATAEVNELLIEHGLKLSNASTSVRRNMGDKRRIFIIGQNTFRVARDGVEHLKSLVESVRQPSGS
jgi:hypothetical protein